MATQPIARDWVEHRFYFAPQVATLLIVLLLLRVFRSFLREQGVRLGDFLRSSVVGLLLAALLVLGVHLDQVFALAARLVPAVAEVARYLAQAPVYELLARYSMARLAIDLVRSRSLRPDTTELTTEEPRPALRARGVSLARLRARRRALPRRRATPRGPSGPFGRGSSRRASPRSRCGRGTHGRRPSFWSQAGDVFAWEAAKAWAAAGEAGKAGRRGPSRWPRRGRRPGGTGSPRLPRSWATPRRSPTPGGRSPRERRSAAGRTRSGSGPGRRPGRRAGLSKRPRRSVSGESRSWPDPSSSRPAGPRRRPGSSSAVATSRARPRPWRSRGRARPPPS